MITAIENSVKELYTWIKQIDEFSGWHNREKAFIALRIILQLLRDNLTLNTSAKLAAELSPIIRGYFYENWRPIEQPLRERTSEEFLDDIYRLLTLYKHKEINPLIAATSVFSTLKKHIDQAEVEKVYKQLPKGIRKIFET